MSVSNKTRLLYLSLLITLPFFSKAQNEHWETYLASYEKGPGSVVLNMDLKKNSPIKEYPAVVIAGVGFKGCNADGLPLPKTFDSLYRVSDSTLAFIARQTKSIHVGSFSYQCERLDYVYVNDTTGLRKKIEQYYSTWFKEYKPYVNIKTDPKWEAYLDFLYPSEEIQEYTRNQNVIVQLYKGGDIMTKERPIEHFAGFKTEKDRNCFIAYCEKNGYSIMEKNKSNDKKDPLAYVLLFSKNARLDASIITAQTKALRKQAVECNGEYSGWETVLIKK